jgi:hypothetical protein
VKDQPVSAAADGRFLGLFREVAAELRHLRTHVEALRVALAALSEDPDDVRRASARAARDLLLRTCDDRGVAITTLLGRLESETTANADELDYWGDQVTEVKLLRDEAAYLLDAAIGKSTTAKLPSTSAVKAVSDRIDEALLTIAYTTVPPRLNQYLKNYRNGQVLRFDKTFAQDILDEHIGPVLEYLHDQPRCVNGIVNVEQKTVIKVSPDPWRRVLTWVILVVLLAVLILAPELLRHVEFAKSWFGKQPNGSKIAGGIVVTFLGALAHVVVGAMKQARPSADQDARRFISVDNWALWATAHEVELYIAVATVGVLGAYFAGGLGETDSVKLLAVGYSWDSVVDAVLPKFEKTMTRRRTEVVGG